MDQASVLTIKTEIPRKGSQRIHRYILGRQLVLIFLGNTLAWCFKLGISHTKLKIVSQVYMRTCSRIPI